MATEIRIPELGENIAEGQVVKILARQGDAVKQDQPILELETGKATLEIPAPGPGVIAEVRVKEGDTVKVGQVVMLIAAAGEAPPPAKTPAPESKPAPKPDRPAPQAPAPKPAAPAPKPTGAPVVAAPSVRKFAREIGIEISAVPGSGPEGRVSIEDVKKYAKDLNENRPATGPAEAATPPLPDFSAWGETRVEPMSTIRRMTADHMSLCWRTIPHVTQFDEADISDIEERRNRLKAKAEKAGGKLTVTAILIKILAAAMKVHPKFNASIDMARKQVVFKKYCHIGVAVDTDRGLLVPVIRDVDRKNIIEIAVELNRLSELARTGKIAPGDLQGGCFTITNLGGIGGTHFTPIINHPEVAILGVGRARKMPCFGGELCSPKLMMPLSLSYDHRLIDGADGARFLRWICEALEEPLMLPLEG